MPLIITPSQLRERAEFYHQLAQFTTAGIPLLAALGQLQQHPPARSYRRPLRELCKDLSDGFTFTETLRRLGTWLPAFDIALIHAGEHSGRLDACLRLLAGYYEDRARVARQTISDLLYPVFLFHFAVFIFALVRWFQPGGSTYQFLTQTLGVLLPIYGVILLMIYAGQSRHGEGWRGVLESLLRPVPLLGTARRYLALGRLAGSLEALLSAGVTIIEAWELAANASGSPALRRTVLAWRPLVEGGQTPAEALSASAKFPDFFVHQYTTGEISGKLDDSLGRLHQYYQEEGTRKLHAFTQWTPRAIYLAVMLMIAYRVINFYMGYFQQVQNAGGF